MFFFVNQYLLGNNSSIEHAEMKRLRLFKEYQTTAKLVTRDFDPVLHWTLRRFGLSDNQLVNMFDFFAGTVDYQGQAFHTEDLHLPFDYQVSAGVNSRTVKDGQRLVAEVFFTGGTVGLVNHVDYYDVSGNVTLRQYFDIRGFKTADVFFGQDGQIHYERYYRPDGSNYLDRYYVQSTADTPINSLNVLKDYQGQDRYFNNFDDLFAFFLRELDKKTTGTNSFIADRPSMAIAPVLQLSKPAHKYLWLPCNHVDDGQNPINGPITPLLSRALSTDLSKWDGIIVMTNQQRVNLQQRIGKRVPVYVINGTPVTEPAKRIAIKERHQQRIIYVGRLGNDKQTDQLLNIYSGLAKKLKNSQLILYGYGSPADTRSYKQQVEAAGLADRVTFAGYQIGLDDAYDQAQLFVDTSRIDAQPLAMGEALAHGVPVVSYDYLYGPGELIQPGVNGELVPLGNTQQFSAAVLELLRDPEKLQKLSDGAYESCHTITCQTTWQQWQPVVNPK